MEENQIINRLKKNKTILEIGSGDGIFVKKLLKYKKIKKYHGIDFVKELVNKSNKNYEKFSNISFSTKDISLIDKKSFNIKFDYIISKRVIQNVLDQNLQIKIIDNLGFHLKKNGLIILVECSNDARKNINYIKKKYNLPKIPVSFHNIFLNDSKIKKYKFKKLKLLKIDNFSSNFYFITRVVYALYSKNFLKKKVNYKNYLQDIGLMINDDLLKIDLSQVKVYLFKKK